MKIIYMGTPDFAVLPLKTIHESDHEIVAVVCQPDKPNSRRGKQSIPCAVKTYALEAGLNIYQPEKVSSEESFEYLSSLNADIVVTCAFGQLLRKNILNMCPQGVINIHASLLPKYRGAAPINRVVMDGEEKSGVTIMYTDEGLDTGDIIISKDITLADMTAGELSDALEKMGSALVIEALELIQNGNVQRIKQDGETNYAEKISKEELFVDFSDDAVRTVNKIRGLDPFPTAYGIFFDDRKMKLYGAKLIEYSSNENYGKVLGIKDGYLLIAARGGVVGIAQLKPEGKKLMDAKAFWAGVQNKDIASFKCSE